MYIHITYKIYFRSNWRTGCLGRKLPFQECLPRRTQFQMARLQTTLHY